jgi:hypothetical protein
MLHFIHFHVEGHLAVFQVVLITDNVAINILRYLTLTGTAKLSCKVVAVIHSPPQSMKSITAPHPQRQMAEVIFNCQPIW